MGRKWLSIGVLCVLSACSYPQAQVTAPGQEYLFDSIPAASASTADILRQARSENLNRNVAMVFADEVQVLPDEDHSGIDTVQEFFDNSDTVVISGITMADQLRAASIAVVTHAPMLTMTDSNRQAVIAEISRLGARYILVVGDVSLSHSGGDFQVIRDTGTQEALGQLTALKFTPQKVAAEEIAVSAVASLVPEQATYLQPGWVLQEEEEPSLPKVSAFPAQSKRDADTAPIVIASERSSIASVASAKAFGATVRTMPVGDPRFNIHTMSMVAGLEDHALIALGQDFGSAEQLRETIRLGQTRPLNQPGGGGLIFPQRTVVLQRVEHNDVESAIEQARDTLGVIQRSDIAAGKNQDYGVGFGHAIAYVPAVQLSLQDKIEAAVIDSAIEKVTAAGGYLQLAIVPEPGKIAQQLQPLRSFLQRPNVGLTLSLGSDVQINAQEVNQAVRFVADLSDESALDQKMLLISQATPGLVTHPERIQFKRPEVAFAVVVEDDPAGEGEYFNAARSHYGRIVAEYRGATPIYFGWGQATRLRIEEENSAMFSDGTQEPGVLELLESDEFSRLSPRPWLVMN